MENALEHLWNATESLHKRFGVFPPDTSEALRVLNEEAFEVIEAALTGDEQELADEAADLIVTLMGVLMARDVELNHLEDAMRRVAAKNNAKTHETHHINQNGKIARR